MYHERHPHFELSAVREVSRVRRESGKAEDRSKRDSARLVEKLYEIKTGEPLQSAKLPEGLTAQIGVHDGVYDGVNDRRLARLPHALGFGICLATPS